MFQFYIYNLGYRGLFPKLEGGKYPLTQTMMIELGILAAVVVVCPVHLQSGIIPSMYLSNEIDWSSYPV